jgi:Coenzyme PQQ synthesis protein D (PqqD)
MSVLYARAPSVEAAPMQGETILFNSETNTFCVLNASAALVWNELEAPKGVDTLAARICAAFDGVTAAQAQQDVENALNEFATLSLVVTQS